MTVGEPLAELRGDECRPDKRQPDLAAVGMAGEGQRDAVGHARKNIRLVDQQHDGIVASDLGKRARQVIFAAEAAVADEMRKLVADTAEPELPSLPSELH